MNEELDAASLKEEAAVMLQPGKVFDGGRFYINKCIGRASIDEKLLGNTSGQYPTSAEAEPHKVLIGLHYKFGSCGGNATVHRLAQRRA